MIYARNTNKCWKQPPLQQNIIVPTRIILHPRLDVIIIKYVKDILKESFSRNKARKAIQRHPITITDYDYDYILDEIERRKKMSLKEM